MDADEERGWLALEGTDAAFATVHPAAAPTGTAAILVPPFGWDDMCSYRARRELAVRLAARGATTLRFDLPGAGDSAGGPWDPDRVAAWIAAVAAAAAHVRALPTTTRVAAVGFGLGGLLAAAAASRGAAVDDLVLWGTPARGRAVVRELQAMSKLESGVLPLPDDVPEGTVVAAGYVLSPTSADALRAVDLTTLALPGDGPRRALLLGRDDLAPDQRLADGLRAAGVAVQAALGPGWGRMLDEPQYSRMPEATLERIAAHVLAPALPASALPVPPPPAWRATLALDGDARERPASFPGTRGRVPAVITEPALAEPTVSVVWLNAGPQRRIGPNRLWVTAARRWAARGVRVVRVDLAGFGDAPTTLDLVDVGAFYTGEHLAEVRAVLDGLRAEAPGRLVLGGLCSGASWAANVAATEPDVAGVLLVNPPSLTFDRRRFELADARFMVLHQLRSPATWRKVLAGRVDFRRPLRLARTVALDLLRRLRPTGPEAAPPDPALGSEELLRVLPERGDRVALIFSGDEDLATALAGSAGLERLGADPRVGIHHVGVADVDTHTLRPLAVQRDVERILDAELDALLLGAGGGVSVSVAGGGPIPPLVRPVG